jgi:hypothetical protein
MHQFLRLTLPGLVIASLAACGGDDPISYSQPVTINLKAKSSDTVNNVVDDDKSVTSENSNPYGKFISDAKAALGGADPGRIELDATTLTLGAASTGVLGLGEVFTGNVEVNFTMNDTNNTYPAAWDAIAADAGSGPLELTTGFTTDGKSDADLAKIVGGSFKVGIRGPAGANFATKGADADIQVTLTFSAYEE